MRNVILALILAAGLAGCGDEDCKNACTKVSGCGFSSSGLSCSSSCETDAETECAACINGAACSEMAADCAAKCPAGVFDAKK